MSEQTCLHQQKLFDILFILSSTAQPIASPRTPHVSARYLHLLSRLILTTGYVCVYRRLLYVLGVYTNPLTYLSPSALLS